MGSASRWPSRADEIVVVLDNKNQLIDYQLFMLGLKSQDEVIDALAPGGEFATNEFDISELLGREYPVLTEADYLEQDEDEYGNKLDTWTQHAHNEQSKAFVDEHSKITLKVVGVIRPRPGVESGCIAGVFGYTEALTELLIAQSKSNPAVAAMIAELETEQAKEAAGEDYSDFYESKVTFTKWDDPGVTITSGDMVEWKDSTQSTELLRALGVVNLDEPTLISFYCNSFDAKEKIVAFINEYNEKTGENVRYGDSLATIMSFVNTMATTLTGVLVTFASISLVVSTIMIAIIIYTSVLERRKEIGVLRSIGARKKDISRVFLAESAILGAYSGIIGVFVSYLVSLIGSVALKIVFGIEGLMSVTWWHCVMMIGISILLSMFAGFIPSRIAAKKDPAIALRSE